MPFVTVIEHELQVDDLIAIGKELNAVNQLTKGNNTIIIINCLLVSSI